MQGKNEEFGDMGCEKVVGAGLIRPGDSKVGVGDSRIVGGAEEEEGESERVTITKTWNNVKYTFPIAYVRVLEHHHSIMRTAWEKNAIQKDIKKNNDNRVMRINLV